MAVLLELSIFSISGDVSKSDEIAKVLKSLKDSGFNPILNSMGSVIETTNIEKALSAIDIAYKNMDSERFYIVSKFDCYPNKKDMLTNRVENVLNKVDRQGE